jgi:hypothetical protein
VPLAYRVLSLLDWRRRRESDLVMGMVMGTSPSSFNELVFSFFREVPHYQMWNSRMMTWARFPILTQSSQSSSHTTRSPKLTRRKNIQCEAPPVINNSYWSYKPT